MLIKISKIIIDNRTKNEAIKSLDKLNDTLWI